MQNTLLLGRAGTGKSTRAREMAFEALDEADVRAAFLRPNRAVGFHATGPSLDVPRRLKKRVSCLELHRAAHQQLEQVNVKLALATPVVERQAANFALGPYAHARADQFLSEIVDTVTLSPELYSPDDDEVALVQLFRSFLQDRGFVTRTDVLKQAVSYIDHGLISLPVADLVVIDDAHALDLLELEYVKLLIKLGAVVVATGDDTQTLSRPPLETGIDALLAIEQRADPSIEFCKEQHRFSSRVNLFLERTQKEMGPFIPSQVDSFDFERETELHWFLFDNELESVSFLASLADGHSAAVVPWQDHLLNVLEAGLVIRGLEYERRDGKSVLAMPALRLILDTLHAIEQPQNVRIYRMLATVAINLKSGKSRRELDFLVKRIEQMVSPAGFTAHRSEEELFSDDSDCGDAEIYSLELVEVFTKWLNMERLNQTDDLFRSLFDFVLDRNVGADEMPLAMLLGALADSAELLADAVSQLEHYLDDCLPRSGHADAGACQILNFAQLRGSESDLIIVPFIRADDVDEKMVRKLAFAAGKSREACVFLVDSRSSESVRQWFTSAIGEASCLR